MKSVPLLLLAASLHAQDTRVVVEPSIPPACAVLRAKLRSTRIDKTRPDTARIQQALDRCAAGHSVTLKVAGAHDAFLAGPLELRSGVTLVIDTDTILAGSRNARDYDRSAGSCGIVDHSGRGCKPLIGADNVAGAGVMGDGVIDGRGGAKILEATSPGGISRRRPR